MSAELRSTHTVTAVLVVHDGARWLPETVAALAEQTRPPDVIRIVDTGSTDRSPEILAQAAGPDRVLRLDRRTGFGAAVTAALAGPGEAGAGRGRRAMPGPAASTSWIWLLHDDGAPAPDALEALLGAADRASSRRYAAPGVLGCKHRDWYDRRVLLEVGLTTDLGARRETGVDAGEHDQGQYDDLHDVLAVGSAGMLVRRDVWQQLRGFDPSLPLYRDDIDFCWRAVRAGHRVQVVPDAVVYHAEASARHRRTVHATASHARLSDRRHGMYTLATSLPLGLASFALVRTAVTSVLRALGWVLAKQLGYAFDELAALLLVVLRPDLVIRGRFRRRRLPRRWRQVRMLMPPPGAALRRVGERIAEFTAGIRVDPGRHTAADPAPAGDEDEAFAAFEEPGPLRRVLSHPGLLLVVALSLVALVAERDLLGTRLVGGALLPAPGGASDLWHAYLSAWHPVGLGSDAKAPPYLGVLALLSTIFLGKPWLAVNVLLLGCVPLAGWMAYLAAGRLGADRAVRVWVSAAYALLPVATGAIAAGRLGTAVAFVVLPLVAHYGARVLSPPARGALRPAWAAGLFLSIATAFAPVLWPMAIVLGGIAVAARWRHRAVLSGVAITVVTPILLLYPWSFTVVAHPQLLLLDTGYHPAYLAAPRLHPIALLLMHPGGPGMYPVWVSVGLTIAALAALLRRAGKAPVVAGWVVALIGLVAGVLLSRATVPDRGATAAAIVWPGVAAAVIGIGLLIAVATAAQDAPERMFRFGFGWRQLGLVALVVIAGAAPLLGGAWWVMRGAAGPLQVVETDTVPAYLTAQSETPTRPRTLIIRQDRGRVQYTLVHGRSPVLGDELLRAPEQTRARLDSVVGDVVSGRAGDVTARFSPYNIRYVLVAGPVDPQLAQRLDGERGLVRQSATKRFALWQASDHSGRLRLLGHDGTMSTLPATGDVDTTVRVPDGGKGRVLVLSDSASPGWDATIGGRSLPARKVDGWAQGFLVPASGGTVHISYANGARHGQLLVQGIAVLVVIVLAVPGARREEVDVEHHLDGGERPHTHQRLPQASAVARPGEPLETVQGPGPRSLP